MNNMSEQYAYEASVVIPVYNGAAFIEKQLQALAEQQTSRSFEVLVSDNGSTDNTRALVERLSLIHISEPTRLHKVSRMPSSA